MPPKLAAKSQVKELIGENSNKKGSRAVAQTMSSSKFGLSGSNMQINIRLGPNRSAVLPKSSLGFSNSKSESSLCNPSANHHCINSFKNDIPDRPSTARHHDARDVREKLPETVSLLTLSERGLKEKDGEVCEWRYSSSWSSDSESELATAGSNHNPSDQSDKQSFAVFSSMSLDSQDTIDTDIMQEHLPGKHLSAPITNSVPPSKSETSQGDDDKSRGNIDHPYREENFSKLQKEEIHVHMEKSILHVPENHDKIRPKPHLKFSNHIQIDDDFEENIASETCGAMSKETHLERIDEHPISESPIKEDNVGATCLRSTNVTDLCSQSNQELVKKMSEAIDDDGLCTQADGSQKKMVMDIFNLLENPKPSAFEESLQTGNSETASVSRDKPCEDLVSRLYNMSNDQLREEVLSLQMLIDDKDSKMRIMKKALLQQKELIVRNTKAAQREMNLRCKALKEEYDSTLNRHVRFIQQLLEEKKKLAEKCESVVIEMRQLSARVEHERKVNQERHNAEIKRLKQSLGRESRHTQEKMMADKAEHMREVTAKALEPELRRLVAQHQMELQSLRAIHQEEIIRLEQVHASKLAQQLNTLRDKANAEREEACTKEREMMRLKYDKQLQELESFYSSKYNQLQEEAERDKKRWSNEITTFKLREEELVKRYEEHRRQDMTAFQHLLNAKIETIKLQHAEKINLLLNEWEVNKSKALEDLRLAYDKRINDLEKHYHDLQRQIKEEEAQMYSQKLATELQRQHEEMKALTEQQIQRFCENHDKEAKMWDQLESKLRLKINELNNSMAKNEEELASVRLTLYQNVKENSELKKTLEVYMKERSDLRNILQKELEGEILQGEEEKRKLMEEFNQSKAQFRKELNKKNMEIMSLSAEQQKTLAEIHEKVRFAIAKKDENVSDLQEKLKAALNRCLHLEELLDHQHSSLLKLPV